MKHKRVSPYRKVYKNLKPQEKQAFINFLKKIRHIFRAIGKAGGDVDYVVGVLPFIHCDEHMAQDRKERRHCRNLWEPPRTAPASEPSFGIKKHDAANERRAKIDFKNAYEEIGRKFKEIKKYLTVKSPPFADCKLLTVSYNMEIHYKNERYFLTYTQTPFQKDSNVELLRKGRIEEGYSNLAMYLLYRHFKRIKLKQMYKTIASLVNEYSTTIFRPVTGSPLSPENVRKRVQCTKKKKNINELFP